MGYPDKRLLAELCGQNGVSKDKVLKLLETVYEYEFKDRRIGTVVGCYLARHGIASGQNALDHIKELRKDTEDCDKPAPETSAQDDFVLSWVEGE
ncbi:MAG: hypothetical protein KAT27_06110 [Desulfobacterales bacterium]|nr:hypothetical protein [Desulfobacterales bacterium]